MIVCKRCERPKEAESYYKQNHSTCKDCLNVITRERHRTSYQVKYRDKKIAYHLMERYGITPLQYNEMLAAQNGTCWICRRPPKKKRLAVDHCHKTGRVRGLLCSPCNHRLLPAARENPELLRRAAEYLEKGKINASTS